MPNINPSSSPASVLITAEAMDRIFDVADGLETLARLVLDCEIKKIDMGTQNGLAYFLGCMKRDIYYVLDNSRQLDRKGGRHEKDE